MWMPKYGIVLVAWLGVAVDARAGFIPIANAGFEDPMTTSFTNGGATGWTLSGTGGVWNINNAPLGFWTVPAPEGNQIGWLSTAAGGGPSSYSQILSASLQANADYTLTGSVGHPLGFGSTPDPDTVYTVTLLAGGNVLASISGTGPEATFAAFTLNFNSAGSAFVGQTLEIHLASSQPQTGFDDIRLQEAVIPEPSSALLLGIGALSIAGWRSRRFRRNNPT